MPYLTRRIEQLLADVNEARVRFGPDVDQTVLDDLKSIQRDENDAIILPSCSSSARALARSYHSIKKHSESELPASAPDPREPRATMDLRQVTRDYFRILGDMFHGVFNGTPEEVAARHSTYSAAVRALGTGGEGRLRRSEEALNATCERLAGFYNANAFDTLSSSKNLSGIKLVLGGTQRFTSSALNACRSMLLYCDTVLIPDPVYPWFEVKRTEERSPRFQMLENVYWLLRLRPLVDADLPVPPIAVFQSLEKTLEANDGITQDGIELLSLRIWNHCTGSTFEDLDEVIDRALKKPDELIEGADRHKIFTFDGNESQPLVETLKTYRDEIEAHRSAEFFARVREMPDALLLVLAVSERVVPQFHLLENSELVDGLPFLARRTHWSTFRLLQRIGEGALREAKTIATPSTEILDGLSSPELHWLGNVPIKSLVELRGNAENEVFRRRLHDHLRALESATEPVLDAVARETTVGVKKLVAEHQRELRAIQERFRAKHHATSIDAWITAAASMLPFFVMPELAPMAPVAAALHTTRKYVQDKVEERTAHKTLERSLIGVLAAAAK